MSLDVYLTRPETVEAECPHCGSTYKKREGVYDANITHNLSAMAEEAGMYRHLWRPDEIGVTTAAQLIAPLEAGLEMMKADPARFEAFNSPNGWGLYENFVPWVERYLEACKANPEALVSVSR